MEKRTMERYNIPVKVFLSFAEGPSRKLTTSNISAGGAFFETDAIIPEGAEVYLSIFPSSFENWTDDQSEIIRLQGKVLKREHGMAICFYDHHYFNN